MSLSKYEFKIPDRTKPIKRKDRIPCGGSWFELVDFVPEIVSADQVIGRKVSSIITHLGSYGMGGPGFFGLGLGSDEGLVIAIWGASRWTHVNGRIIKENFRNESGALRPWITEEVDELTPLVIGREITGFCVKRFSLKIHIGNDLLFTISESHDDRSEFKETCKPRLSKIVDDLRKSVFLSPTPDIWI